MDYQFVRQSFKEVLDYARKAGDPTLLEAMKSADEAMDDHCLGAARDEHARFVSESHRALSAFTSTPTHLAATVQTTSRSNGVVRMLNEPKKKYGDCKEN